MNVHFIDTSVFTNIVNVPNRNQQRNEVMKELTRLMKASDTNILILPFASIVETGNHIAHCSSGDQRRAAAIRFREYIKKTLDNEAPWSYYTSEYTKNDIDEMCKEFPEKAMSEKMGMGDLSIIQSYNKYKRETPAIGTIRIWSVDSHLKDIYEEDVSYRRRRR